MALFYSESGSPHEGLPLILLHGFCETHKIWRKLEAELAQEQHVLSPDLPGFGQSPAPAGPLSLALVADSLYSWLQDRGIEQCMLLGHSLGGYISLAFLEKYPHMVAGIGLMHSTAFADTEERKRSRHHVINFVEKHGVEKFINSFVPPLFFPGNRKKLQPQIEELLAIARSTPKETLIAYTRAMQQRKSRLQVLQQYEGPILYIAGEYDTSLPQEDTYKQILTLSNCQLHILKDTAHMGMYESPEESLQTIKNFVHSVQNKKSSP
jgi:pimeloyl-ACP methyl ester carboxylesterase